MSVTNIEKDLDALTMTVNAEFDTTVERTWQLWSDPRRLERWWGPPAHPATVVDHDLAPGAVTLSPRVDGGTRVHIVSRFSSRDAIEQLINMGMDEGLNAAMSQADAIVAG